MINYANKIKEYREVNFLTQEDFAKLIGVSLPTVSRWENGHFQPTIKVKKKLFELFTDSNIKFQDTE